MNIEELRNYCLSIKGSSESTPFIQLTNNTVLVFKVMDKMFAYIDLEPKDGLLNVCLKCNPDKSFELREQYRGIMETPFKSLMWNSVCLESDVPDKLIEELINHSVEEVVRKLPKKKREEYKNL
jgi:predicted DNA-binding protein (MmcQ/YjbR family)